MMATPQQIGGYTYRQHIISARQATATARRYVERIIDEQPGPALSAVYLARIGLALGATSDAINELDRIGRQARPQRHTEQ